MLTAPTAATIAATILPTRHEDEEERGERKSVARSTFNVVTFSVPVPRSSQISAALNDNMSVTIWIPRLIKGGEG